MEEKLRKEKEEAEAEAQVERTKEEKSNENEIESVSSESVEKPIALEEDDNSSSADTYIPGPIRVSTEVPKEEPTSTITNSISSSELPPVPQIFVEQERLEMIEINNDGTSGHLTHNI